MNAWIWRDVFAGSIGLRDDIVLVGIGTILDDGLYTAMPADERFVCFGSGTGYARPLRDMNDARWLYKVVRGPLSARLLGIDERCAVTDGAILLADLDRYRQAAKPAGETLFIPHHQAAHWPLWQAVCARAGVAYLSPENDAHQVFDRIRGARLVIADSMHAAICADTFRVPWVAVTTSDQISTFKWTDWALSMGLAYRPTRLPPRSFAAAIENAALPFQGRRFRREDPMDAADSARAGPAPLKAFLHKQAGRGYRRVVRPIAAMIDRHLADNAPRFDAMVAALAALRGGAGCLSDQRVFDDRRQQMQEHRQAITRMLRGDG